MIQCCSLDHVLSNDVVSPEETSYCLVLKAKKNLIDSSHLCFASHLEFNSFDLMVDDGRVCSVASLALKHRHLVKKNSLISRYCPSCLNRKTSATKGTIIVRELMSSVEFHSPFDRRQT